MLLNSRNHQRKQEASRVSKVLKLLLSRGIEAKISNYSFLQECTNYTFFSKRNLLAQLFTNVMGVI